ncbi:vitelline membrane outer layer protein 1 homolog [Sceloporus undulatus]|uniref:vitelline membrane outer layer protein 1 homolog n=1 Tax=Sceloporus undulatus TaxID=8520 RepID=UPI001C4BBBB0|nr:vitelline membrane outer layer protein 1 homolog [Sceloporus undulatus]
MFLQSLWHYVATGGRNGHVGVQKPGLCGALALGVPGRQKGHPGLRLHHRGAQRGPWGIWACQEMCPQGTYTTGFSIKVESYQGAAKDDMGLNGVRLLCTRGGHGDKREAHAVESQSGR